MDLIKLGQGQLQLAITFSGILAIGLDEAASILASYSWDIERAMGSINLDLKQVEEKDKDVEIKKEQLKMKKKYVTKMDNQYLIQDKNKIQSKSIIKKNQKYKQQKTSNFSLIQQRNENQQQPKIKMRVGSKQVFLSYITNKYHPLINFAFDDFDSILKRSVKERKYILIYVHHIDDIIENSYQSQVVQIMVNKDIVNFINYYCITYGVIYDSSEYTEIAQFLSNEKDKPIFGLFQYNHIRDKIQLISHYDPKAQDLNFLEWLSMNADINVSGEILHRVSKRFSQMKLGGKDVKKNEYQKQILEERQFKDRSELYDFEFKEDDSNQSNHYDKSKRKRKISSKIHDYSWEQSFINDNQSQISSNFTDKINVNDKIRQQQDAAYDKMQKSYMKRREISQLQHEQSKLKSKERQAKEKEWQQRLKKLENEFQQKLDEDFIQIKFRLPDGVSVVHKFALRDLVQKIFNYVDLFCRNHFEQRYCQFELKLNYKCDFLLENVKKDYIGNFFKEQEGGITIIVQQI